MANFKEETRNQITELINNGVLPKTPEIDTVYFQLGYGADKTSGPYPEYAQRGGLCIDWEEAAKALNRTGNNPWEYNDGYGSQAYEGWITFKGSDVWLERAEYDGSEWWEVRRKPTLDSKEGDE